MAKKRRYKRRKPQRKGEKRIFRGCQFRVSSWAALEALALKYQDQAGGKIVVSNRLIIESLIEYAEVKDIAFVDLLGLRPGPRSAS